MLPFLLPCNPYTCLCFSDGDALAQLQCHLCVSRVGYFLRSSSCHRIVRVLIPLLPPTLSAASRTRSTLPHPKLPLNYGPPQLRMMYQCHCWAGLGCYQLCGSCHLRNPQARLVFCAFQLFGEGQKAACHGRFLRGSRTFPQSQVCFGSAGADKQLEEHLVELDAFSYGYAD